MGIVTVSGTDTTTLKVDGDYSVTGPLETFANAGGVHVARALLAEFSTNMAKMVAERRSARGRRPVLTRLRPRNPQRLPLRLPSSTNGAAPAPSTAAVASRLATSPPPAAAAELSAGRILWAAFKSWLSLPVRQKDLIP